MKTRNNYEKSSIEKELDKQIDKLKKCPELEQVKDKIRHLITKIK